MAPSPRNERITENMVRDLLRDLHFYGPNASTVVEEQKSQVAAISRLLKGASKSGGTGTGCPEFIIHSPETPDFVLVIECKADVRHHESKGRNKPKDYAVDGALVYASRLAAEYTVIAAAVSGQSQSGMKVTTFLHTKGAATARPLLTKDQRAINKVLAWTDYVEHASFNPEVAKARSQDLMDFARELHEFMRDHAKLTESEKPLLVSGTLIALKNKAFAKSFGDYTPESLQKEWLKVIQEEIERADIPESKTFNMTQPYSSIAVHPELGKETRQYPKGVLHELIRLLNEKVWPFVSVYHDFDVVGQFYGEFLKYTGGDKKALGIVLTPRHVTELFSHLANLKKDSRVLDLCCGTAGFLIGAMNAMMKAAVTKQEKDAIKRTGLIGVEQQPSMYALAASNMILRGDGKANLYQGSCFDEGIRKAIRKHKCDVGMINPPYSQSDADLHELQFVKETLDALAPGGTAIAIVPVSCALDTKHPKREELLRYHTLEAVMTMPAELFYPVGVVTCIMVFTAGRPHEESKRKTWFGYWKDDGFVKVKNKGRVDLHGRWPAIRDSWVKAFRNREDVPGLSVKKEVTAADEWCAEEYMETDYSKLTHEHFAEQVKLYAVAKLTHSHTLMREGQAIRVDRWKWFQLSDYFELKKGKRLTKANMRPGDTPFIGAIDSNNGLVTKIDKEAIHDCNTITVNYNGNGVAEAFFQPKPFWCSDDVNVLYPKFDMSPRVALFLCAVIRLEKYRFSYGRKWHLERMRTAKVRLPATKAGAPDWKEMDRLIEKQPLAELV